MIVKQNKQKKKTRKGKAKQSERIKTLFIIYYEGELKVRENEKLL